ncbi:hypothetical protein GF389_01175 [Candidatus Dojkabacteria bacterium]|nr:hypothetical protein [Candidatus Dojkabacteria bacterium]
MNLSEKAKEIRKFPSILITLLEGIPKDQLIKKYPIDNWTIAQVVHHIADVHPNKFAQIRSILVQNMELDNYEEKRWINLPGSNDPDLSPSLKIIEGVHERLALFLMGVNREDLRKMALYDKVGEVTLERAIERFIDHGHEHIEQIKKSKRISKIKMEMELSGTKFNQVISELRKLLERDHRFY